ncbi:PadR family transcriptional regulator [Cohnella fermenti]|uniref:PadR family transcriptional regulator n=1 Tax=Cohnella fermenti TaxID=2565925 RepID=A0A4S4C7Z0_9BACL|nr:PadR family transcriptional regulator [Cohnella fermenti]THF83442.1 PadR family transcriptional regulator [Cohnella fermenti]
MSAARLLVLGALARRGIAHGYGVHQDLVSWRADTWTSVKPGSIYHALEKLASQGLIEPSSSEDSTKLGPARTEYAITEEGRQEFIRLLEAALKNNDFQMVAAGIAFMEFLPRARAARLLEERLDSLRATVSFLRTLPTQPIPADPSKHPELVGLWVGYFDYAVASTESLLQALRSGSYLFIDEQK